MFSLADIPNLETPPEIMPSYEGAFLKMFLALIGLLVAIFVTVWVLKRFAHGRWTQGRGSQGIKIIERKAISPKTMLYVIEIDGKQTLIAESQLEIKPICSLDTRNSSSESH